MHRPLAGLPMLHSICWHESIADLLMVQSKTMHNSLADSSTVQGKKMHMPLAGLSTLPGETATDWHFNTELEFKPIRCFLELSASFSRWNKYLAKFVNSLCKHLNKRLAKEAASQTHGSSGTANGHASQGRQHLSTDSQRCLARVILRMADKAQYSKVCHVGCCLHVRMCMQAV